MDTTYTAFASTRRLARGGLADVAVAVQTHGSGGVLVFDDATGRVTDLDLRGTAADVKARYALPSPQRGPGRPKLGVVAREVTLLPRHWEWLATQPGGASVALRKLVDAARQQSAPADQKRSAQEKAYRFMSAMAGNEQGFEEATRALFAGDAARIRAQMSTWPGDVRDYTLSLADGAFL